MKFKKFTAFVLLCLYAFNLCGYLLLFHLLEHRAEQHLQTSLDKEAYAEDDLITLSVPLSLPYVTDTQGFERVDGEITISSKIYHYVKRAIKNGELVLLCLPDHQKMKLESAKHEYFKLSGDFEQTKPSKKNDGKSDLFKDIRAKYCAQHSLDAGVTAPVVFTAEHFVYSLHPTGRQRDLPDQPPEAS